MHSDLLKLATPRLTHCNAVIQAIADDIAGRPAPGLEHRMLQIMARMGPVAGSLADASGALANPDAAMRAQAQLFDCKLELFLFSASIQVARAESSEKGPVLRSMLAHQLASMVDHIEAPGRPRRTLLNVLRSMSLCVGRAMTELETRKTNLEEVVVQLHLCAMQALLIPEDNTDAPAAWFTARLGLIDAATREKLEAGLLRQVVKSVA